MLTHILRKSSSGLAIVSFALIIMTGLSFSRRGRDDSGGERAALQIAPQTFGTMQAGATAQIILDVKNDSDRIVRIVGAADTCLPCGCMRVVGVPRDIAPRACGQITICIEARRVGDLQGIIPIYTDIPGATEVPVQVSGVVTK